MQKCEDMSTSVPTSKMHQYDLIKSRYTNINRTFTIDDSFNCHAPQLPELPELPDTPTLPEPMTFLKTEAKCPAPNIDVTHFAGDSDSKIPSKNKSSFPNI